MSKFDVFEKVLEAVRNKFQLNNEAIHPAGELKDDVSKLNDLGEKVKELTSGAEDNLITKEDVIYGRNPEIFKLTQPLIKDPTAKVNIIEPAENKLFIVQEKIEVGSNNNKTEINNEVYGGTTEKTVENIQNEIKKLKQILDELKTAIKESQEEVKKIKRISTENALPEHNLTPVPTDKIADELKAGKELVYIGNDKSKVYYKPENNDDIHLYTPPTDTVTPRENQFDADHSVVTDTTLEELENTASRDNKTLEKYELFSALDYTEDGYPGLNGLRYNHEPIYKINEGGISKYVILKSNEDIFDKRYKVDKKQSYDSLDRPAGGMKYSDKLTFDRVKEMAKQNPDLVGKIHRVTEGADEGYYIEVLSEEAQFDKDHGVLKNESMTALIRELKKDTSENPKIVVIDTKYDLAGIKEEMAKEGAVDKYKVIKVTGGSTDAGYYLVRAYTQEEKDLIAEELALSTQGLEDNDVSDNIPNMVVGRYKTSTMNKKSTGENSEYYVVTDVDYLKLPEYRDVVKIKPSDFNELDPKYYLKKHDKDGLDVVYKPTISPEKAPLVVKPEVIEALHKYSRVLSSVYEYENDALKPYTFAKMLLDDVDTDRNNVASLYMTDGKGNYYTIAREEKVAKKLPSTNVEYFYNGHDMKHNFLSHVRDTAITPFSRSHLVFSDTQIDKLIAEDGPFYNKFVMFEDNDPTQIDTDKLLTTRWAAQFEGASLNEENVDKYGFKDINGYKVYILKKDQPALTESDIAAARAFVAPRVNKELTDAQVREVLTRMGRTNISDIGVEAKASLSEDISELNKNYIGTSDTDNVYNINIADGRLAPQGGRINEYNVRFYTTVGIKLTANDVVELAKTTKDRDISGLEAHYTLDQVIAIAGENPEYNDLFDLEYAEMVEKSSKYRYLETDNLDDKVLPLYDRNETNNNNRSKIVVVIKDTHLNDEG